MKVRNNKKPTKKWVFYLIYKVMKYIKTFEKYRRSENLDEGLKSVIAGALLGLATLFPNPAKADFDNVVTHTNPFTPGIEHKLTPLSENEKYVLIISLTLIAAMALAGLGSLILTKKEKEKIEDSIKNLKPELDKSKEQNINRIKDELEKAKTKEEIFESIDELIKLSKENKFDELTIKLEEIKRHSK